MVFDRQDVWTPEVPAVCRGCEARQRGMCGVLDPAQLADLARQTHRVRHEAGAELVGESTEITAYANVTRGVVKLTKVLEDGRQQVVGLQFAPDFLGRLYGRAHAVAAEAASPVDLCVVPRRALESLVAASPALGHKLLEQALRELDEARDWLLTLGRKSAGERVASFLLLIAVHADPEAAEAGERVRFELPLTRADIADFLGLTIETVSRQLTKLRQRGVIAITNNRLVDVPDLDRLRDLCS